MRLFTLLGCDPVDRGGQFFTSFVDPGGPRDHANNVLYASEVRPEQWAFERSLLDGASEARKAYVEQRRHQPQHSTHFGFRVATETAQREIVDRVRHAGEADEQLAGRVAVDGVYRPDEPDAIAPNMVQAFIWTDVVAAGLLCLGQHIEVQWHLDAA